MPLSSRMNPNPLSIRRRAIVPVGIPVSSDERTPKIIPGALLKLLAGGMWAGGGGPRKCRRRRDDQPEPLARCGRRAHGSRAELESGASVGSSYLEVKKAVGVRG